MDFHRPLHPPDWNVRRLRRFAPFSLLAASALLVSACIVTARQIDVEALDRRDSPVTVRSPVRAHLLDGSTVVFRSGVSIERDTLRGAGQRYDLRLADAGAVSLIPLDSVVGMESFRTGVDRAATVALSIPATMVGTVATAFASAALFVAIFGSCPTIYSEVDGEFHLEAEAFSYSIAPLFEARGTDVLRARAGPDGFLTLEVRNEALETHYINHLELLEVRHRPGDVVMPDPGGRAVALSGFVDPTEMVDRAGRDVRGTLTSRGGVYQTDASTLDGVSSEDFLDHIDIALPSPEGVDSVAIALRLRNSLLTTVLFYDLMLEAPGARALDWIGEDLQQIGPALELGGWFAERMGLRISVWDDGGYREVARVTEPGPIAWKQVAAMVPVPAGDTLRVRLSFVADGWRIDEARIATAVARPSERTIPVDAVLDAEGTADDRALSHILDSDDRYLQTTPANRFTIHFDVGPESPGEDRTFMLASQGYYIEWLRPQWIASSEGGEVFRPSNEAIVTAIGIWREKQAEMEAMFEATKIPVR
jgi:hypothetical protein